MMLRAPTMRRGACLCRRLNGSEGMLPGESSSATNTVRIICGHGSIGSRRDMMAKAKKGAKDQEKSGQPNKDDDKGLGYGVIPINYLKDGTHPPIKPDEEYPDWLWNLPQKSKALLSRIHDDDITVDEMRRLLQLRNRDYIKAQNTKGQF